MTILGRDRIAKEAEALGKYLLNFAGQIKSSSSVSEEPRLFWPGAQTGLSRLVSALLVLRKRRAIHIDDALFLDAAWGMLLGLCGAHLEQKDLTLEQVFCLAECPRESSRRWFAVLKERGLVEVWGGEHMVGQQRVRLTEVGSLKMIRLLAEQQELLFQ